MPPFHGHFLFYIALAFASLFALLLPPFQSPDEPNHFFRAWQVSEGRMIAEKRIDRLGAELPIGLKSLADTFAYLKGNAQAKLSPKILIRAARAPYAVSRDFVDFANTAIYAPFAYLPQATAIGLIRTMGFYPLLSLYAARLFNVLIYFYLFAQILRLLPQWKELLFFLALLPAGLVMVASANPDVLGNAWAWLLIALFLGNATGTWHKWAYALLLCLQKPIAAPLVLLGFRKGNGRETTLLLAFSLAAALAWGWVASRMFIPYDQYNVEFRDTQTLNSGVNPPAQFEYIAAHPLEVASTLMGSFARALPSISAHLVGKFGWEKNYLPAWLLLLLWAGFFALLCVQSQEFSRKKRGLMLLVAALYGIGFALSNYALWSPVAAPDFDNWQGRYFVPVLPLLAFSAANSSLIRWRDYVVQAALVVLLLGNLGMLWSILARFWLY